MTATHDNLSALHRDTANSLGPRAALLFKRNGLFHEFSWQEYRIHADRAAAMLIEMGVEPGDRIATFSENRLEWPIADIAILSIAAVNVPLYPSLTPAQAHYQISHGEARGIILQGEGQLRTVTTILDQLPKVEWIITFDSVRVQEVNGIPVDSWQGILQRGAGLGIAGFARVLERETAIDRSTLATILYTSGTTGHPKGVMLSHGNFLSNAEGTLAAKGVKPDDLLLNWLPFSHVYGRLVDLYLPILAGATVALAESLETLVANIAEVQPTWMASVPRFYEKVWNSVSQLPLEERRARLAALFGARMRGMSSGGAPLPRHVAEGFWEVGVRVYEGYGLSESSPVVSFNTPGHVKLGTVGAAIPGVEIKTAPDGEILTKGPHVMLGYWKDREATEQTIVDGWLHTGDVGTLDSDGFLTITDRKKDLIITSGGKNIAPGEIERLLTSDPYIDQAVLYGDRKHFVSALVAPNLAALEAKARELGCAIEVAGDFITTIELREFLAERIEALMQTVSSPERVKAFLVLARPLSIDAGEMTTTLKVRRKSIVETFQEQLDSLYTYN